MKVVEVDGQQAIDWGNPTGDIAVYSFVDGRNGEQECQRLNDCDEK